VIDRKPTESAKAADQFITLPASADFEALWILRGLIRGVALDATDVLADTGLPLVRWQALADRLKQARLAVFLFDSGLTAGPGGHVQADALWALVRDLNAHTRAIAASLLGEGNSAGAKNVVCWRTGAPGAVDLSRGYPRFGPGQFGAEQVLARREADAALIVATDLARSLSPAALAHLANIPRVLIGPNATSADPQAAVAVTTAHSGRSAPGTIFRMDGVPLPLRPVLSSEHPSDVEILAELEARVKALAAAK
jgi:formylmethanofuran dehydrogenase subunit B